jgi:adenosylhomocysteine nucleosidase
VIALLAPMRIELGAVARTFRLQRDPAPDAVPSHTGRLPDGTPVGAVMIGVGTAAARASTERLLTAPGVDVERVIVVGVAGGIDASLSIADVVVPEVVVDAATGAARAATATASGPLTRSGRLITSDEFLTGSENLARLRSEGYLAIDMETSGVAEVCEAHNVPWCAIRAISDTLADEIADDDVVGLLRPDGTTDPRAVLRLLRRRPGIVPRLIRLGRDTKRATAAAAAAAMLACRPA